MMTTFELGESVVVSSAGYTGEVVEIRENGDCLIRYSVLGARKPFYETWWPTSYLEKVKADAKL